MSQFGLTELSATRHRFVRTLGSGRFAEVTCVLRQGPAGFKRLVALKRPHSSDASSVERLLREARIGGLLRHESIVATLEVERDEEGWYLVLEYVDGPTLAAVLSSTVELEPRLPEATVDAGPSIPIGTAFSLAAQLCAGLHHAHTATGDDGGSLQLVHGDLSPANVLLTSKGQLKIADFGAASSALLGESRRSSRGTPGYAAPESLRHEPIDARADVYSAGAILRDLFAHTVLRADPALREVLDRATAQEPANRFPDTMSLATTLASLRPLTVKGEPDLDTVAAQWIKRLATLSSPAESLEPPSAIPARPYRGLDSFGPDSASLFFGREDDVLRIARRVRSSPLVVLTGASGAGKSSILAAGLPLHLPDMTVLQLRPGPDPMTRLARLLGMPRESLTTADGTPFAVLSAPIMLVVDQAEELLTLAPLASAVEATRTLVALADQGRARVLFSVRADHLAGLCDLEPLRGRGGASVELLSLPNRQQLAEALVRPLEPFGCRFESPLLIDRIVSSLVGQPGALALLQFCADQLWDARDPVQGVLREADLDALGGVEGAITTYADRVLESLAPEDQKIARHILVRCLHGGARHPLGVAALLAADWAGPNAVAVLDRLVGARLLARRADPDEGAVVEPAHEALVAHWKRLARWVTEDALGHQVLSEVIRDAKRWARGGSRAELLWTGGLLSQWLLLEADLAEHIGPVERRFVDASVQQVARRRRVRLAMIMVVCVISIGFALMATWGWRTAASAQAEAELARRDSEIDAILTRSAHHRERGETGEAVRLARSVLRASPASSRAISELYAAVGGRTEQAILTGHEDAVRDVAFTPDGRHVVSVGMDGIARVWDATGRLERVIEAGLGPLYRLRVSPLGDQFVVLGAARQARLYRLDGTLDASLDIGEQPVMAAWDSRGQRLILTGTEGKAVLFEPSGRRLRELVTGSNGIGWATFSRDGSRIAFVATGGGDGRVVDGEGRVLATIAPAADATYAEFSGAGRLITASWPGLVQLYDASGGERARVTGRSRYPVAGWTHDGSRFVAGAASDPGALEVISEDGAPLSTLSGHGAPIYTVATGAGGLVASGDEEGEIRVFSQDGTTLAVLDGHAGRIWSLSFDAAGTRLASAAEDGTIRLWDARGRSRARLAAGEFVEHCQIDPLGERVLAHAGDHRGDGSHLWLFSTTGERLATWNVDGDGGVTDLRWRPDGREAVVLRRNGGVLLITRDGLPPRTLTTQSPIRAVDWREEDLLASSEDGHVSVLTRRGEDKRLSVGRDALTALAATSGLRGAAAGADGLHLYDLKAGSVLHLDSRSGVLALCWSPDGTRFVAGRRDGSAELRDAAGALVATLDGHRERVPSCSWHPNSRHVATASWDGNARIWNRDGVLSSVVGGHRREVQTATWSPDGTRFLTTEWAGQAMLSDSRGTLAILSGHGGEVVRASWAERVPLIATCGRSGREIRLWPATDAELQHWAVALVPEAETWLD